MKITHLAGALCALASSAICQIAIPAHASTYNGFSRGFNFTANTDFYITKLDLPPDAKQTGDTASYMIHVNQKEVLRSVGNAGALTLTTPMKISSGDRVDVIGNWSPKTTSNFSAHNSYGSTAPFNTTIEGVKHVLNRIGWQWDIGDTAYKSGSMLNPSAGSIGRVLVHTAPGYIGVPTHASTYNGFSRGFNFTAATNFLITKLDLPPDAKQTGDTASYMIHVNQKEVLRSVGNAGAITLKTPLRVNSGDRVDVIGNWSPKTTSNFSAHNSYGSTAPFNTTIEGVKHVLNRIGWQWDIGDTAYKSGSMLNPSAGSIGRVLVYTAASESLTGTPATISIATGGAHTFSLDAGTKNATRLYWIFGSVTGTSPGVTLASPVGPVNIPLQPDLYTDITIAFANSALLSKTKGVLDASGKGTAALNVPKGLPANAVGVKLYHAYLVYDGQGNFYGASNAAVLTLAK